MYTNSMITRVLKNWTATYQDKDGFPTRVYARDTDRKKEAMQFEYMTRTQEEIKRDFPNYLDKYYYINEVNNQLATKEEYDAQPQARHDTQPKKQEKPEYGNQSTKGNEGRKAVGTNPDDI